MDEPVGEYNGGGGLTSPKSTASTAAAASRTSSSIAASGVDARGADHVGGVAVSVSGRDGARESSVSRCLPLPLSTMSLFHQRAVVVEHCKPDLSELNAAAMNVIYTHRTRYRLIC